MATRSATRHRRGMEGRGLLPRFARTASWTTTYAGSHETDRRSVLNAADRILEDRFSPNARPNRFSLGGGLDDQFGRVPKWGSGWNGLTDAGLGGWSISAAYQYQTV